MAGSENSEGSYVSQDSEGETQGQESAHNSDNPDDGPNNPNNLNNLNNPAHNRNIDLVERIILVILSEWLFFSNICFGKWYKSGRKSKFTIL